MPLASSGGSYRPTPVRGLPPPAKNARGSSYSSGTTSPVSASTSTPTSASVQAQALAPTPLTASTPVDPAQAAATSG